MKMTHQPKELRLAGILARHVEQEGGYVALARAINESNGLGAKQQALVDRRKLKQLVFEVPRTTLSVRQLKAINRYLVPFNEDLAHEPLFYAPESVVRTLAGKGRVTFLLGSKPEDADFRVNFSRWDVVAMVEVQQEAYRYSPNLRFDFSDVLLHRTADGARKSIQRSAWAAGFAADGPSLVCLGSTRALHATELMLALMFGVRPFDPRQREKVPFHFVWSKEQDHVFPSSFHFPPGDLGLRPNVRALRVGSLAEGKILADSFTLQSDGDAYGVVVAQRRPKGQLWICLAGVTGLGTLAAARALRDISIVALEHGDRRSPVVFWMPIRARVSVHPDRPAGRLHELGEHELLATEPHRWPA